MIYTSPRPVPPTINSFIKIRSLLMSCEDLVTPNFKCTLSVTAISAEPWLKRSPFKCVKPLPEPHQNHWTLQIITENNSFLFCATLTISFMVAFLAQGNRWHLWIIILLNIDISSYRRTLIARSLNRSHFICSILSSRRTDDKYIWICPLWDLCLLCEQM